MNKNESKYFNTAVKMDKAFLELIEKKDFAYITVKEICERAGVNRSTFYLHYETVGDLLSESMEYMNNVFAEYMKQDSKAFFEKMHDCPIEELFFITPEYLTPYLRYIKDNRRLFLAAMKNSKSLSLDKTYDKMFSCVFSPILERYNVPSENRRYMMAYYIHGLMAIITEWIKGDCKDTIEYIGDIIHSCVMHYESVPSLSSDSETDFFR